MSATGMMSNFEHDDWTEVPLDECLRRVEAGEAYEVFAPDINDYDDGLRSFRLLFRRF